MAFPQTAAVPLSKYFPGTPVQLTLAVAAAAGLPTLLRLVTSPGDRAVRFLATIVVFYFAYQLLVVIPYAFTAPVASRMDALSVVLPRVVPLLAAAWVCGFAIPDLGADRVRSLVDAAAALLGLWTIVLYVTRGPVFWYEGDVARLRMIWGSSAVLLGWAIIDCVMRRRRTWTSVPVLLLSVAGLVLTNVRAGYVALLVAFLLQVRPGKMQRFVRVAGAIVAAALLVALVQPSVRHSVIYSIRTLADDRAGSAQQRITRWHASADYAWHHPLGDRAAAGFEFLLDARGLTYSSHNMFLEILVSEGIPGLVFILLILGATLRIGWRYRQRPDAWFFFTYLCFYLVFALFNSTWYLAQVELLFSLGLGGLLWASRSNPMASADGAGRHTSETYDTEFYAAWRGNAMSTQRVSGHPHG
jgi:O-antigen ligase